MNQHPHQRGGATAALVEATTPGPHAALHSVLRRDALNATAAAIGLSALALLSVLPTGAGAAANEPAPLPPSAPTVTGEAINFALLDQHGRLHELRRTSARVVVLFFTGNGCPIARQNLGKLRALQQRYDDRGVVVWLVNSNAQDDRESIRQEARQFGSEPLPVLMDDTQGVARYFGVQRTCETIAIRCTDWHVVYQGAVDNQFVEGAARPWPTERFLETALDEILAGKTVANPRTTARGCLIDFELESADGPVSYVRDVAPILLRKCAVCHRLNDVGSWVMSEYRKVKGMSAMMREVILARRMPPWDADPQFGTFSNDRSLTVAEARTLLRWIELGAPRSDGPDPLPAGVRPAPDWPLGTPDQILRIPRPEQIPASGVIDLRHQFLDPGFTNDVWLGGLDVRPGNRQVLHHVTLRTIYPGQTVADPVGFAGWNPGHTRRRFPPGTGKLLRKGVRLHVDLHYTPIGTPQSDQTEIGLYLLSGPPRLPIEGRAVWDTSLSIPPGEADYRIVAIDGFDRDTLIYDLRPHMHWRGAWFKFELLLPTGVRETLLSVPRYDFNWQTTYLLAEPRRIPAGSWMVCSAGYDNSNRNPANPDSTRRLHWGEQSADEMFIGHFDAGPAPPAEPGAK